MGMEEESIEGVDVAFLEGRGQIVPGVGGFL